ncbi:hypothetical protein [Bacteroides sp. An51A]|uniref:hypothetical protein n=1 Tax=Bacteroides sp. An51A TaxID=1965640 RepID=UPI000B367745|nr:hypothetical protein [Bacteroides sp. An51A]OUN77890.1 hypothetical protein B5G04_16925 [Bacteroides sp. An51A]
MTSRNSRERGKIQYQVRQGCDSAAKASGVPFLHIIKRRGTGNIPLQPIKVWRNNEAPPEHIKKGTPITVEIHKPHIRFGNEKKALPDNAGAYHKAHRKRRGRTAPTHPKKSFSHTKPYRNQKARRMLPLSLTCKGSDGSSSGCMQPYR